MGSLVDDLLNQVATGNHVSNIASSVGGDQKGVQSALNMALPLLMSSMAKTASNPSNADALTKTLTHTAANNPMDDLASHISNPAAAGGTDMLNMLLGNQTSSIQNAISQKTGLPASAVNQLLAIAAPMVMGAVSKKFVGTKMDQNSLTSLLNEHANTAMQSSPEAASIAQQVLDNKDEGTAAKSLLKKLLGS